MFESAELGHSIDKKDFAEKVPALRDKLLEAQYELLEKAPVSVVVLIAGVDGAGKGETVNTLHEWMDPRHLIAHAVDPATKEDRERPRMFRFWERLPPRGKIGIFLGSWYTDPIVDRVNGTIGAADLDRAMEETTRFERMLTSEHVLVLKFWLHLSKKAQKKRLRELSDNPRTAWRVTPLDWERFESYDRFRKTSERALRATSTGEAPWYVVEATDDEYRELTVGTILHDALRKRLDDPVLNLSVHAPPLVRPLDERSLLGAIDLEAKASKAEYDDELERLQGKLNLLFRKPSMKKRSVVTVFEGADAAGKGGAIRRITEALDARQYRVHPVAAPTDEERARPYLWRFWRHLPRRGRMAIFDRSWYGRVLVERVERFCDEDDWLRAYGEINDFEESLAKSGSIVLKYWLQVSPEEQLRRFEERSQTSFKRFKITAEDWRNRDKWDAYQQAASEMIDRTSTEYAPWKLVGANDKRHARLEVLRALVDRLESEL
jgi:polyphosphate:AMP phosphotransferase